jgi:hypothetical protein
MALNVEVVCGVYVVGSDLAYGGTVEHGREPDPHCGFAASGVPLQHVHGFRAANVFYSQEKSTQCD